MNVAGEDFFRSHSRFNAVEVNVLDASSVKRSLKVRTFPFLQSIRRSKIRGSNHCFHECAQMKAKYLP